LLACDLLTVWLAGWLVWQHCAALGTTAVEAKNVKLALKQPPRFATCQPRATVAVPVGYILSHIHGYSHPRQYVSRPDGMAMGWGSGSGEWGAVVDFE